MMNIGHFLISTFYSVSHTKSTVPIQEMRKLRKVYAYFSYPCITNRKHNVVPLYINTHKSLAQDPRPLKDSCDNQCYNISPWQINMWIMVPMILYSHWAEKFDQCGDGSILWNPMLVLYTARYHIGQKWMAAAGPHGAINRLYDLNLTDSLGMGPN